jgi:hypothetical protein
MTTETEMKKIDTNNAEITVTKTEIEMAYDIPDNLVSVTMQILRIHQQNGDLAWVSDMLCELEAEKTTKPSANF